MSEAAGGSAEEAALAARRRELLLVLWKAHEELGRWPGGREREHRIEAHATRCNLRQVLRQLSASTMPGSCR